MYSVFAMKLNLKFLLLCCYYILCSCEPVCIENAEPIIETTHGLVAGRCLKLLDSDVATFLGIPYAKPPVGKYRFCKPQPVESWKGTFLATEKAPSCMQFSSRSFPWIPSAEVHNEDCLYLNVWTPNKCCMDSEKLPVMVWIHGGGYYAGSSTMDVYDGTVLSSKGKVVVVSFNYRLGVFGFFNGGNSEAPGNLGLYDQLLVLQWIKANIEHFGGDSKRITIFGESAGAMSISLLLASPLTQGLFHRAIMQSGVSYHPHLIDIPNISVFKSNKLAEIIGCVTEDENLFNEPLKVIDCLRNKDAEELAKTEDFFTSKFPLYFVPYYGSKCTACNDILPDNPIKKTLSRHHILTPTLIGTNKDEGAIFLSYMIPTLFSQTRGVQVPLPLAKVIIKNLFSTAPEIPHEEVFEFYFRTVSGNNNSEIVEAISNAFGDYVFVCPSMFFAEKAESYVYWMTYRSSKNPNNDWLGVTHFDEIQFVFGKPILSEDREEFTDDDRSFSSSLIKKWADFARDGFLSENEDKVWNKFSRDSPMAYELNRSETHKMFPRLLACEFWRPYFEQQFLF